MSTVAAAAATVALAGVAFAWWSGTGTGSAGATADTAGAVTLTAGTPAAELFPGGTSDVSLTITNPNLFSVKVGSLALDTSQGTGGFSVDAAHAGCGVSALSFTTQTTGWTVPAKVGATDGSLAVTLVDALSMTSAAASACQGATFTVFLVAGL